MTSDRTAAEAQAIAQIVYDAHMYPKTLRQFKADGRVHPKTGRAIMKIDKKKTLAMISATIIRAWESNIEAIAGLYALVYYNDQPTIYGDVAWAKILAHSQFHDFTATLTGEPFSDEWTATFILRRICNNHVTSVTSTFSWADAKQAELTHLEHYQKHPARMLNRRARAPAMRDLFADVIYGLAIAEEQQDHELGKKNPPEKSNEPPPVTDKFTAKALENITGDHPDFGKLVKKPKKAKKK